ncbi:hypothetical protein ABKP09_24930 [Peribacillus frigoritolerans]|uniref:hypothetical protein n=1 Tax=Peribacillus frigoritolerans TaxID=450367 RepID=UPI0032B59A56
MKKIVGILVALVIVLGALLIFSINKNGVETKEKKEDIKTVSEKEAKPVSSNEPYQFQDIESMEKATSIKEAFERIFGKDRLFDDYEDNESFNREIKYSLYGVYNTDNIPSGEMSKYLPEKQYFFESMFISIAMKPGFDTRMEMIDFLHYLQFSGLTKPGFIKESLPEDSVKVFGVYHAVPEEIPPFLINMSVFQQIKPGMNLPEPHQKWSISSEVIEVMDFSDKEDIFNRIQSYGTFDGYNPSSGIQ